MRRFATSLLVLLACVVFTCSAWAQKDEPATATCNFDEEKQLVVNYQSVVLNSRKDLSDQIPFDKVWAPGGKPMTLFTNTPVEIGSADLPIGAYTMFLIPTSKRWTLIISKSTEMNGSYDQQQDLVRVPMDFGELPQSEPHLMVSFAHAAPTQCNIRVDLGKRGHFTSFHQK